MASRVLTSLARNPFRVLVTLVLSGCAGMIAWNALVLQQARHPSPLFTHPGVAPQASLPAPPARAVAPASIAPPAAPAAVPSLIDPTPTAASSPPVPPARTPIGDLIRNNGEIAAPPARPAAATTNAAAAAAAKPAAVRDPIADMIRMGGAVPVPPANVGRSDGADPVLGVQRALAKLGYAVKPDGVMGGETRTALERFEQDHRLPVTGAFNARTLRELGTASGLALTP